MVYRCVPTIVVLASRRARCVMVGTSCCVNLDAPVRGAPLNRQRRWGSLRSPPPYEMAAMLCGLQYVADNRLVPLDGPAA